MKSCTHKNLGSISNWREKLYQIMHLLNTGIW